MPRLLTSCPDSSSIGVQIPLTDDRVIVHCENACESRSGSALYVLDFVSCASMLFPGESLRPPGSSGRCRIGIGGKESSARVRYRNSVRSRLPACRPHLGHHVPAYQSEAVVSITAVMREDRWINAHAVVPHTQPELLLVVADFSFDLPR